LVLVLVLVISNFWFWFWFWLGKKSVGFDFAFGQNQLLWQHYCTPNHHHHPHHIQINCFIKSAWRQEELERLKIIQQGDERPCGSMAEWSRRLSGRGSGWSPKVFSIFRILF